MPAAAAEGVPMQDSRTTVPPNSIDDDPVILFTAPKDRQPTTP